MAFNFNPVLSEIQGHLQSMSPDAQAVVAKMGGGAQPAPDPTMTAAPVIPHGMLLPHPDAGPEPAPISMGNSTPSLSMPSMPSATPQLITGPNRGQAMMSNGQQVHQGTLLGDQTEGSRLRDEGSGISQISGKIQNSGLGQAHPLLGKILGGLAQGAVTAGDIALRVGGGGMGQLAEQMIPGTEGHHELLVHQNAKDIAADTSNAQRQAQTAAENATAQHTAAETPEVAPNAESLRQYQGAETEHLGAETENLKNPPANLAVAYAHAVNQAIKEGRDPAQDPIVGHLSDAITGLQRQAAPKGREHVNLQDQQGRPYGGTFDPESGKYFDAAGKEIANPVPYEKPIRISAGGDASLDREAGRLGKPYEKGVSDANAQLEKIADARTMVNGNMEAQALGIPKVLTALVSGQGSGVRITQAELNMIGKARGIQGDVEGTLNSWAGKGRLSAEQQRQLTGILDDVKNRIIAKQAIHNDALDKINGAASRGDVIAADREARQKLNDLEKGGNQQGGAQQTPTRPQGVPGNYQWNPQGNGGKGSWRAPQ